MSFSPEEAARIADHFNNQEGQPYPCSNQIVCCGYITPNDQKWDFFVEKNKPNIRTFTKNNFILNNGEEWIRVPLSKCVRGYRFYKVKVDRNINKDFFNMVIAPRCGLYCCDFEWI